MRLLKTNFAKDINCFETFLSMGESRKLFSRFRIVQFDLHAFAKQDDDDDNDDIEIDLNNRYLSFDEIADQIVCALEVFNVRRAFLMGVGVGGNILCRVALSNGSLARGLVLMSVTAQQSGWAEFAYQKMALAVLATWGVTERVKMQLLMRYFGESAFAERPDRVEAYSRDLARVDAASLANLVSANSAKLPLDERALGKLRCPTLCIASRRSYYDNDTIYLHSLLPATRRELFIADRVPGASLVTEESPDEIIEPIRLWFEGLGQF
jgi:pimeloyl-ACP methyl ester carboxylesterase